MTKFLLTLATTLILFKLSAQPDFTVHLDEQKIENATGVHSYTIAQDATGYFLIIGGRIDGLHKRRPFESFLENANNKELLVINPTTKEFYSADLEALSTPLFEQLQSTNMEFETDGDFLYIIGGYGYSSTKKGHVTYSGLVKVEYKKVIEAIINHQSFTPYFTQVTDDRFAVTGGYLHCIQDTFYLVGGQNFTGQYNPMGPTHGPSFKQEYTNEIRKFTLKSTGEIDYFHAIRDTVLFHRRDFNTVQHIDANGNLGLMAFTGVFQYKADIPWLNVVKINGNQYREVTGFQQKLNQYHTAHLPIFDSVNNEMHTLFFGGMAQYAYQNNTLIEDIDVPFVKTISVVTRDAKGQFSEYKMDDMPGFLGSGAEFIPVNSHIYSDGILRINRLKESKVLVGYIYGGIESDQDNIFFTFDVDKLSRASNKLYAVYLDFATNEIEYPSTNGSYLDFQLYPNPTDSRVKLEFENDSKNPYRLEIYSDTGNLVFTDSTEKSYFKVDLKHLTKGSYLVILQSPNQGRRMGKVLMKY